MHIKKSIGSHVFDACNIAFMLVLMAIMLYPLLHVLALSMSSPDAIIAGKVSIWPTGLNIRGYYAISSYPNMLQSYFNTICYAAAGTGLTLSLTSLIAYPLSIKDFVFKKLFTIMLAVTMYFGGGLIPTYLIIRRFGLINTFAVMVLPFCVSAYTVMVFRTFFAQLPVELRESAYIDGANDVRILFQIILPLSKPLLATFALFAVVGHWNGWFNAMLYLNDEWRMPLQILLRRVLIRAEVLDNFDSGGGLATQIAAGSINPKNIQMAITVVTMAPILAVYPFVQRYFVKGMLVGTIKG